MEGIFNIKDSGDQIDDKAETYEEGYKGGINRKRYSVRERTECRSGHKKGTCVIWCVNMPFWYLVIGAVGLRVTGIWGQSEMWRRQSRRWWTYTPCHNN